MQELQRKYNLGEEKNLSSVALTLVEALSHSTALRQDPKPHQLHPASRPKPRNHAGNTHYAFPIHNTLHSQVINLFPFSFTQIYSVFSKANKHKHACVIVCGKWVADK